MQCLLAPCSSTPGRIQVVHDGAAEYDEPGGPVESGRIVALAAIQTRSVQIVKPSRGGPWEIVDQRIDRRRAQLDDFEKHGLAAGCKRANLHELDILRITYRVLAVDCPINIISKVLLFQSDQPPTYVMIALCVSRIAPFPYVDIETHLRLVTLSRRASPRERLRLLDQSICIR